ncbi:MAG TPA: FAD-dependent oxidoreductase, partial [Chroococcidiopsis sp.]
AQRGVRLHLETGVEAIAADRVTLSQNGQPFDLPADLVLWTAGTEMQSWLQDLPCQHNAYGQLKVNSTLQLVDYPNVYVLGDNADLRNGKGVSVPATAQVAYQQASCAAANLWKNLQGRSQRRFRYLHLGEMMTLGHNAAVVSSFGIVLSGSLAQLIRKWVYAQRLPTLHHRLEVMGHWLFGGMLERLPDHWQLALRQQIQTWLRPQKIRSSIRRI